MTRNRKRKEIGTRIEKPGQREKVVWERKERGIRKKKRKEYEEEYRVYNEWKKTNTRKGGGRGMGRGERKEK